MSKNKVMILTIACLLTLGAGGASQTGEENAQVPAASHSRAVELARQGELDQALELIKQALIETDYAPETVADYIVILAWKGEWKEAISWYEKTAAVREMPAYVLPQAAKCYRMTGEFEKAAGLYRRCLQENPGDLDAFAGLVYSLLDAGNVAGAQAEVDGGMKRHPDKAAIFILQAEVLEAQGEYVRALGWYDRVLEREPDNAVARNRRIRALLNLGAASLAREQIEASPEKIDPELLRWARGDELMYRIRWHDGGQVLTELEQESGAARGTGISPTEPYLLRSRFDRILVLRELSRMDEVVREYVQLQEEKVEIPVWVHEAAADAYLYRREPEKALAVYELVIRQQPNSTRARMGLFQTLVELGRFRDAGDVLDALDRDTPAMVVDRGLLRENWEKADIVYARAWWLMYQDRLKEADDYLQDLASRDPINTNILQAAAHDHYWRGWRRLAREDFEIVKNLDPENVAAANGYCLVLNANGRRREARKQVEQLLQREPANNDLQRTRTQFRNEDMQLLTVDAGYTEEHPGSEETYVSVQVDHPVTYRQRIFARMTRQVTTSETGDDFEGHRFYFGCLWEDEPTWTLTTAISANYHDGDDRGVLAEGTYSPSDYFTFAGGYETKILSVPLRSRVSGVSGREARFSVTGRASELFSATLGASDRRLTDDNASRTYYLNTDIGLTTRAWWKTRLLTDAEILTNSRTDVDYYSPAHRFSFQVIPMVEHTWFRRYERALVDRLFVGIGEQHERGYSGAGIGYVEYQQEHRFSDRCTWIIGARYARRYYDGVDVGEHGLYTKLLKRF